MFAMSRSNWKVAGAAVVVLFGANVAPAQSVRPVGSSYSVTGVRPWSDSYSRGTRSAASVVSPATVYAPSNVSSSGPLVGNSRFVSTTDAVQPTGPAAPPAVRATGTPISATTERGCCSDCH